MFYCSNNIFFCFKMSLLEFSRIFFYDKNISNIDLEQPLPCRMSYICILACWNKPYVNCLFLFAIISPSPFSVESYSSNTKPWSMGHARKTVPHRSWNQNVGYSLFCHTEAMQRRNIEVRLVTLEPFCV